jgi:hypothetical protein
MASCEQLVDLATRGLDDRGDQRLPESRNERDQDSGRQNEPGVVQQQAEQRKCPPDTAMSLSR